MVRILISDRTSTRSYYVEEEWDKFIPSRISTLSQYLCEELIAYYKGENVTEKMIHRAREWICYTNSPLPLPIKSTGSTLSFNCTDGVIDSELDVGTFVRQFEYISELYDFDPSITSIDVPFTKKDVDVLVQVICKLGAFPLTECTRSLSLAKFLRPFRVSIFLDLLVITDSDETLFLTEVVSKQMEWEDKAASGYWAAIVPDERVWPLIEYLRRRGLDDVVSTLLKDRPLALLIYYVMNANVKAVDLLQLDKYEDGREVNLIESPLLPQLARSLAFIAAWIDDLDKIRSCLTVLGINHYLLARETKCPLIDYLPNYGNGIVLTKIVKRYYSLLVQQGLPGGRNEAIVLDYIDKYYQ